MKIVADESVDRQIVTLLRLDGHSVFAIAETSPGVSDELVLAEANRQQAVLITADTDFGELVFRLGRASSGVLLFRLAGLDGNAKADLVAAVCREHASELIHAFTVVTSTSVRIRRSL